MLRRIHPLLLVALVLILAITACGGDKPPQEHPPPAAATPQPEAEASQPTPTSLPSPDTPTPTGDLAEVPTELSPASSPTITASQEVTTTPGDFASGGLGLSQRKWEETHVQSSAGLGGFINYDDEEYSAIFTDDNVQHLERSFAGNQPTLEKARVEAASLIPDDSQLVKTYSPEGFPELIVDLYLSESLKGQFESDVWINGEPGNFIVIYGVFDEKIPRIVIGTGNNP